MKIQLCLLTLFLSLATTGVHADTVFGILEADTYIRVGNANDNFGTSNTMLVGRTSTGRFNGLLRFDLTNLTALGTEGVDYTINSVTLTGTTTSSAGSGTNIDYSLYEYGFDFVENVATWNDPDGDGNAGTGDTIAGGTFGPTALSTVTVANAATTLQSITFADSSAFQASISGALSGGSINLLLNLDPNADRFLRFQQNDGTNADPFELAVDVTIIPEPSTLALFGLVGAAALVGYRRKR